MDVVLSACMASIMFGRMPTEQFFTLPLMLCIKGMIEFARDVCGGGGLRGPSRSSIYIYISPHMQNTAEDTLNSLALARFDVLPVSRARSTKHVHARDPG